MRRIGWKWVFALTWAVLSASDAAADEQIDRILVEWQKRMASVSTIDARFRMTRSSPPWGETKHGGRVVLASPNVGIYECTSLNASGAPEDDRSATHWTGHEILSFDFPSRTVDKITLGSAWQAPPLPLCLPFLFQMTVEQAKEHCDWTVVKEGPDRLLIQAKLRDGKSSGNRVDRYLIHLDRRTFHPRTVVVVRKDAPFLETYEVLETRVNTPLDVMNLGEPCLDSWTVRETWGWLARGLLR